MTRARLPALPALLAAALLLGGCAEDLTRAGVDADAERAQSDNPLDRDSLNDIMLTVAGSEEAIAYFREGLAQNPEDPKLRRGLARSLSRAGRNAEARLVWRDLVEAGQATPQDRVDYALSLARLGMWDEARAQADQLPEKPVTARRLILTALLADHREDWAAADDAYERARALSAQPAMVLNNWGVSRLARGEHAQAERLFEEALVYDPDMFNAKNNLALSYGLQGRYRLPLVTLSEEEKAVLLHNLGVIALRQGDRETARGLFEQSVAAHPQHYAPAADKLEALGGAEG
jgi:Flp pilus assembly protein TadD